MDSPMLVGEVRVKISRIGVSWTLSGGNQAVCGPTKSSKYLQVRRAAARRNRRSSAVSVPPRQLFAGRLITITATGKRAHKRRKGVTATIAAVPSDAAPTKRSTQAAGIQSRLRINCRCRLLARRWHQTPAQIIEDLPAIKGGKRIGFNPAAAHGDARLDPINNLPVAANPTVLPIPPCDVTARKDIQQLDVCRQPHADMAAFQQIMAQQVRRWKSSGQEPMKRLQFVDAFAVITAFSD